MDGVVPLAVEGRRVEVDAAEGLIGDLLLGRVGRRVECGADGQAGLGGGAANEVNDHVVAHQGTAAPVLRDVGEQAVFDLVPLAGTRREVADGHAQPGLVREALQRDLPQPRAAAVAAAPVGGDEQVGGTGVGGGAHLLPPAADGGNRQLRGVVVGAYAHPALVGPDVVDAVGDGVPHRLAREVVHVD